MPIGQGAPNGDFPNALIIGHPWMNGGITLGNIIVLDAGAGKNIKQHEYGHYLQYKELGTFNYYLKIGIPSLYNSIENGIEHILFGQLVFSVDHHNFRTETDANVRSNDFFGEKSRVGRDGDFFSPDTKHSPITWYQRGAIYLGVFINGGL